VELFGTSEKHPLCLGVTGIGCAGLRWTHGLTSLVIEETNALRASRGIDHILTIALADSIVGTFRLTSATIDTFIGDMSCHIAPSMDGITANAGTAKSRGECINSHTFRQPIADENNFPNKL
jgi:hypothetical protein